jgi:hypothetical protein
MPDRLAELLRQRALVQEHLAWLNQQIADAAEAAKGKTAEPLLPASPTLAAPIPTVNLPRVTLPTPVAASTATAPAASVADADQILAQYKVTPVAVKEDVRKGCLLYFVAAFVLLGVGLVTLYFLIGSRS